MSPPQIAALLSVPVCGLGHLYAGRILAAAFLYLLEWGIAAALVLVALWWDSALSLPLATSAYLAFRLLVAWLAARGCRRCTEPRRFPAAVRWSAYVAVFGASFLVSGKVAGIWRNALTRSYRTVGDGMGDTVQAGERILVNLAAYAVPHPFKGGEWRRYRDPLRGDVICYRARNRRGEPATWVHRVVAVPGDHFEIRDGKVRVNGSVVDEPFVTAAAREPFGPFDIPAHQYVVLGDDRRTARDSRYPTPGLVFRDDIIGRAACVWWGRFGKRVR